MEKDKIDREKLTKYEIARILGARALQISMDAPLLSDINQNELLNINYNPMDIAKVEFEKNVLPITVKQPFPKKKSVKVKKIKEDAIKDKEVIEAEIEEEKEIGEEGEIMELAIPEDEVIEEEVGGREASEELQ